MRARSLRIALLSLAATCTAQVAAGAQESGSRMTREFIAEAAQADAFEMMAAASAIAQSHDPQVVAFASQTLRDHGGTMAALASAAMKSAFAPPPMQMNTGQAAFLGALQSARGPAFDKLYWHQQALAHRAALIAEQRYAAGGDAPAIKDVARKALPIIQSHLATAERMDEATPD